MKLPAHPKGGVQVGISDILQYRDCPARMQEGMKRHAGGQAPESWSPANAYGSAIHLCIEMLDDGAGFDEAAAAAFKRFGAWLEPNDLDRLHEDMNKYLERDPIGVRTILNEGEISFRLFEHPDVGPVWFRARIDRLYQSTEDPHQFTHVDYKSSKWAKSFEDVQKDLQLWSYNVAITEFIESEYPELELERVRLQQIYDQLNYGQIPTSKGPQQRESIKRWLITAITAIIDDADVLPKFNEWCPWCHLKMDCPVVQFELTDWAQTRIAALMPREPKLKKDGTPSKVLGPPQLDRSRLWDYIEVLHSVKRAEAVLKLFNEEVTKLLKQLPESELEEFGKRKAARRRRGFSSEAKRQIIDEIGLPAFLMLCDVSLASVERFFQAEPERAEEILALAADEGSYTVIVDA